MKKFSILASVYCLSTSNVCIPPATAVSQTQLFFDSKEEADAAFEAMTNYGNSHPHGTTRHLEKLYRDVRPKLILVRGLPGSGKSTEAKRLMRVGEMVHCETDKYFGPNYEFNPAQLSVAHAWCQDEVYCALKAGKDVVVSNTFSQTWEMQVYRNMAEALGIEVQVICMKSQYGNIHAVPEQVIEAMTSRWEDVQGEIIVK